jgi:hypothetical protein
MSMKVECRANFARAQVTPVYAQLPQQRDEVLSLDALFVRRFVSARIG